MVAIVIPYYKIAFFEQTLSSLADQSNGNFKVYIGNDNSPENPEEMIDSFRENLNITYKNFEDNLGGTSLPAHWERCIKMTKDEEWIMILGDDDFLQNNVVSSWYAQYKTFASKTNLVRFSSRLISGAGKEFSGNYLHPIWESAPDAYFRKHRDLTRSSLSEYIFSKEAFRENKFYPYPLGWHSDDRAWLEFSKELPIYTINEAVVDIRLSPVSLSGRTDNLSQKATATQKFLKYLVIKKISSFKREQRLVLIRSYENFLEKHKKMDFWDRILLFFIYLKNYENDSFKKFLKRNFRSLLKHDSIK